MRIQVLNLPDELVDGQYVNRFALILDEYAGPGVSPSDHGAAVDFNRYAIACGAKYGMVFDRRVEITQDDASAEMVTEIVKQLDELITRRLDEHVAARTDIHHHVGPSDPSPRWHRDAAAVRRDRVRGL